MGCVQSIELNNNIFFSRVQQQLDFFSSVGFGPIGCDVLTTQFMDRLFQINARQSTSY